MIQITQRYQAEQDQLSLIEQAQSGSIAARNELVVEYLPQMRRTAAWLIGRRDSRYDDAVQMAALGMFDSIRKFDPNKGVSPIA